MPQLPTELLNAISEALVWIVVILTATAVALWVSLAIWTFRDMRARTRDVFAWLLATLLVLATGPFGLLLYFLLRPRETLADAYDRQLEEEALLRDISARRACPTCQTVTEPEWLMCPHCRTTLRNTCGECGRPLELDWVVCPFCTEPVADARPQPTAPSQPFGRAPEAEPVAPAPTVWEPAGQ
jgi:RNA polymerase subunit RPABC4/transcription elongation factor Spt4